MSNHRGGRPGIPALGVPLGRTVTAGAGLTGGGALSGNVTLDVGAGTGITVNANDVALAATVAGAGLTHAAGVLAVGAGTGITVNADDVAVNLANAFAWAEAHTFTKTAIGTAQTAAITAQNTTAAALGAQQYGPMIQTIGQGWGTGGGGDTLCGFGIQARPVQGATPYVILDFMSKIGAGAWTYRADIDSVGRFHAVEVNVTGQLISTAAGAASLRATAGGCSLSATYGLDCESAAVLPIGKTTATGVQVGKSGGTVGLYAATPVARAAHIVDADGTLADVTSKFNTLLVAIENIGILLTA